MAQLENVPTFPCMHINFTSRIRKYKHKKYIKVVLGYFSFSFWGNNSIHKHNHLYEETKVFNSESINRGILAFERQDISLEALRHKPFETILKLINI